MFSPRGTQSGGGGGVRRGWGSGEPCPVPSEDPFGDFQSLLFHARQRGAGHGLGPHRPGQAALLQHKVIVGSGVHGVENIGVVRDTELCGRREGGKKGTEEKKNVRKDICCALGVIFFPPLKLDVLGRGDAFCQKNKN